jgi:hypothetical protein
MANPDDPEDEVSLDPFPGVRIPDWLAGTGEPRLTRRARILVSVVAVVVIGGVLGGLKLAGVLWTIPPPKWVSELGPGVTVTGPARYTPGHGSPGAAFAGVLASLSAKDPSSVCDYILYGPQARCRTDYRHATRAELPYAVAAKTGYVAIDGTRALLGYTGGLCAPGSIPRCISNDDPSAIFSEGQPFGTLWTLTVNPSFEPAPTYSLLPCVEVDGKWYYGTGPAAGGS